MKIKYLVAVMALFSSVAWTSNSVSVEQLLSRKGMSCDVDNTHLLHLTMNSEPYLSGFRYQFSTGNQTLKVKGIHYTGIQAVDVLRSGHGQQLALGVNANRFGLKVNRVALNVVTSPFESIGYYWVAQGTPVQNRAALQQLFAGQTGWQDYVSTTAGGNTRVNCTIAG